MGIVVAVTATGSAVAADASDSPLSWRLQRLSTRDLRSATPREQGEAVSLLPRGGGSLLRDGGSLVVDVRVDGRTADRAAGLRAAGAEIIDITPAYSAITASVNEGELRDLATTPGVESVVEQITPMTGRVGTPDSVGGSIDTCATGTVSEGDVQLNAAQARTEFDVDGTGITVGVLSDSYDTRTTGINASDDVASGDLPGAGNPCGRTTPVQILNDTVAAQADEGRAMLQIVHDLAPGSQLAFATGFTGDLAFANNIRALANAGAKVIADDVIYLNEPIYQDGVIAKAVNDVTAQGVSYFSMAFNNNGNGVNSYEAADGYRSTTCPAAVLADRAGGADSCMDFDPGPGTDNTFDVNVGAGTLPFRLSLAWAEAQFGVGDDFDFYVFNGASISAKAVQNNLTSQTPTEFSSFNASGGGVRQIVVRRYAGTGSPRLKFVSNDNGANTWASTQAVTTPDVQGPTIYGHNGAESAQTLGAVPFNDSATVETYSSRGPVTYLFAPVDGTTPSPTLAAPQVLAKPNVSTTDGGRNTFFGPFSGGFFRFFGTSAATPHAAAVGALQLEANSALGQASVKDAQTSTADLVGALGANVVGSGLVNAVDAIGASPPPAPTVTVQGGTAPTADTTPTVTFATSGDVKTLTCAVDRGAPQPCTSPFTVAPPLGDGAHLLTIGAINYFNASGSASAPVTIDTKAPVTRIRKGPKRKTFNKRAKFTFSAEAGATLTCKLDKAHPTSCSSPAKFKVKPGKHALVISAADAAGNVGDAAYKWKVKKR